MATTADYGLPTDPLADPSLSDWAAAVHQAVTALQAAPAALVGEIRMYGNASAPSGWLVCDGTAVQRADYPALFGVLGTTFGDGLGDGLTFSLPNLQGRVPMGGGSLGQLAGQDSVTLTEAQLAAHTHEGASHSHAFSATSSTSNVRPRLNMHSTDGTSNNSVKRGQASGWSGPYNTPVENSSHSHTVSGTTDAQTGTTGSTGNADPVDIQPSHQRLSFIVFTG